MSLKSLVEAQMVGTLQPSSLDPEYRALPCNLEDGDELKID